MDKKYVIQCAVRGCSTKKSQKESVPIHRFPERGDAGQRWIYHFPNFRNKILCILDTNM